MLITLPDVLINKKVKGNLIKQIGVRGFPQKGELPTCTIERLRGHLFQPASENDKVLVIPKKSKRLPTNYTHIVQAVIDTKPEDESIDLSNGVWLKHPLLARRLKDPEEEIQQILDSWENAFSYIQEDTAQDIVGLRNPQIGAIHAVHAHWSVSSNPATIVMPTGTGKTETMLGILVSTLCPKLLVVVPTDALRTQLADKFLTLGILKTPDCAVINENAKYPIVCTLQHIPRTPEEVDEIFGQSLVIVTTSSIAGQSTQAVQERMAHHCPYLFIDEAHHAEAPTWKKFKSCFQEKKILQFTATPFREDGKPLDGDIIFKYPLKKAQEEGYFKPIRFTPVIEYNPKRSDAAIAEKAIEQLRVDMDKGHILMARVNSVSRAKEIYPLYSQYPEFNPVELHTGITAKKRADIRRQIINKESRIVICVDMLGEGFDLPELKIAAFHDIRKTLAVTLQLAGRFTRSRQDLGKATFIANKADVNVQDELRKLYVRDPDWNILLPKFSDKMIGEQLSLQKFLEGITEFTNEIPIENVRPANSMVAYKTECDDWTPENFKDGIHAIDSCEQVHYTIYQTEHTLVVVTARREPLKWCDVETLFSWAWELYIVIWSPKQNLLFINSSTNTGEYKALAQAIAGESVTLINGQNVFRAFSGIHRLRLQNVGLTEQLGRNIRYTGRMGSDIEPALPDVQRHHASKSVISGIGFEDGAKVSIGASRKGRIWSHRRDRINQLKKWCQEVGEKILDDSIDPDEVLKGTLNAETIFERPAKMPIAIDWPEEIIRDLETFWWLLVDNQECLLSELDIKIISPSETGNIAFNIVGEQIQVELELNLDGTKDNPDYSFVVRNGEEAQLRRGVQTDAQLLTDFFFKNPPVIWFVDGSALEGNQYVELKSAYEAYNTSKIQSWDWNDVNIRKESQGKSKEYDSIQARVIRELQVRDYDVIFDDDGSGEAADIVTIRLTDDKSDPASIEIEFYHCKFSLRAEPGKRIEDLYEVCGQAQKSISWLSTLDKRTDLFTHLLRREARRKEVGEASRIEKGDTNLLETIKEMSRQIPIILTVYIVQPGLSKTNATPDQLQLLSVTENHLMETYQIPFRVICSA